MFRKLPFFSGFRLGWFSSLILISIFASCAFLGCGGGGSTAVTPPPPPAISVAVQAAAGTVDATDLTQVTATVTNDRTGAGVSWILRGTGTLSNESTSAVTYTAPAPSNSAQTVTVTATSNADPTKTASATVTVPPGPAITTAALGSGSVGNAYTQQLTASGGIPPYTWNLAQGSLPSCLTLTASSSAASISGTPNSSCVGTFSNLIFQVTDSGTPNALIASTPALQITIAPIAPPISVAVQAAAGTVDATDPTQVTATVTNDRNSAGVSWTLSGPGTLSNESTSAVTYTAPAPSTSAQTATVTATSNADPTKTASATVTVPPSPAITTTALASGYVGSAYTQQLTASGGIPPYTWKLTRGALPSCLTITASSSAASIAGTPNASCVGTFSNLVLQVTDSGTPNALSASTPALQITIAAEPPITFTGPVLSSATYNVAFTGSASAMGGAGALTYSSTGALPPGISLNPSSGALTGTPTAVGIYRFSVIASDAYGDSNSQAYLIGVSQPNNTPIQHVVVIMQENRTLDNLFNGFPGADTVQSGSNHGTIVPLTPVPLAETVGLDHSHLKWWQAWDNGMMDGFAINHTTPPLYSYTYVQPSDVQTYWNMASQYTLADQFFQSNSGPSFPAHEYMVAAQSADADEDPYNGGNGCDDAPGTTVSLVGPNGTDLPGPFPCFNYMTAADLLDANGVTWRYYAAVSGPGAPETAYEAVSQIFYSADEQTNAIAPYTQVLTDIANGELAQVTWVTPDYAHSDLPGNNSDEGPDWVASVVNAVGASPFWNSTAIFINWDDWGGLYDHVPPVNIDEMGPGFRTPLIVVSPYAKHGFVFHEVSETASLVTFIEKNFNLPSLNQRDAAANDLFDCFDFTQSPSPYIGFKTKVTVDQLLHEKPTGPPDDD